MAYQLVEEGPLRVVIVDDGHGTSITNDAERVVREMTALGLGNRRLVYRDTAGTFDEILHDRKGRFVGFRPCLAHEREALRKRLEMPDSVRELFEQPRLGPTGRNPGGEYDGMTGGELRLGVRASESGFVEVGFGVRVSRVAMTPDQARGWAQALSQAADAAEELARRG